MDRQNLASHFDELSTELKPLCRLLGKDNKAREIFGEFMDHNEFELALHVICDSLLDRKELILGDQEIETIELLHEKMHIRDQCGATLRMNRRAL
jgi:hypothetical protein